MEAYVFSNSDIDRACRETDAFLLSAGIDRREALRIRLTFEEVLLKYQKKFGADGLFCVRLAKRFFSTRLEIIVEGECFDALEASEEDEVLRRLLAGIGLAPSWSYKHGKNRVLFMPKRKPLSGTTQMLVAIGLAVLIGSLLRLLPEGVNSAVNELLLSPVTDAFMGLISAVAGPLVFLSVLGSICSMGNMETLGKIGSRTIKIIFLYMSVIAAFMLALGSIFYPVQWGGGETAGFSQVLELIYDIIPSNLFNPFITGNTLQLIFLSVMIGLSMLTLSSRVSGVFSIVEQLGAIVQTMMEGLSSLLPVLIFFLFTGMISSGNIRAMLDSWQIVLVIGFLMAVYYALNVFRIALVRKISPRLLFKKALPTFMICLMTASSAAAYSTNIRDAQTKFGIDKKLVDFGTSIGQVLYMPGLIAVFYGLSAGFAKTYGIPITLPWLFSAYVTCLLVSLAMPPIPGSAVLGLSVVFTQLGIPMEVMGIALAVQAIMDFPCTACDVSSWQLVLIEVADSLHMLDRDALHSANCE